MAARALGDVGDAVNAQEADRQVAQRCYGAGASAGAGLGAIFISGDVTQPVQAQLALRQEPGRGHKEASYGARNFRSLLLVTVRPGFAKVCP